MEQTKILVVDDDREIVGAIAALLELEGYTVLRAYDGLEALDALHTHDVQLMILDVMMPRMDGLSATMQIRKEKNVPILLLSAKTEDADKIAGLAIGADDYIVKPFSPREVVSRIKAVLRRTSKPDVSETLVCGNVALNIKGHSVTVDGKPVELTLKEFELLKLLMQNPGVVLNRDTLLGSIWGYDFDGETRTVDVHIRTLRCKLGEKGDIIETVRGVGYKIGNR